MNHVVSDDTSPRCLDGPAHLGSRRQGESPRVEGVRVVVVDVDGHLVLFAGQVDELHQFLRSTHTPIAFLLYTSLDMAITMVAVTFVAHLALAVLDLCEDELDVLVQ